MRGLACAAWCVAFAWACAGDEPLYFAQTRTDAGAETGSDAAADASDGDAEADLPVVDIGADTRAEVGADAVDEPTGSPAVGGVTVFEVRSPAVDQLNTGGVAAGFSAPGEASAPDAVVGPCEVRPAGSASDLIAPGSTLDAGAIDVQIAAASYRLELADEGEGPRYRAAEPGDGVEYFTPGDAISVSIAGGADVGAASLSLAAPAEPIVTEPAWGMMDSHDRDEPLVVRWGGEATGTSVVVNLLPVTIFPEPGIAEGSSVTCTVEDTGSFTVPVEALAYLPEGGGFGGGSVALTVARLQNAERTVGAAAITLNVTASHTIVGAIR